jgi:ribokinase
MSSTRKPLVVIGSANMDLLTRVQSFPRPGETMPGSALQLRPGGKGANQAVAAARAGAPISFVGNIGAGAFGDALVANLQHAGIDLSRLERSNKLPAGTALILLNETGENEIVVTRSSNELVSVAQIKRSQRLIQGAGMVLLQLEIPLASVQTAVAMAHAAKVPVVLNPAPCTEPLSKKLLAQVDWLTPNEHELAALTGNRVKTSAEVAAAAKHLLVQGAKNVVVTCGAKGACWVTRDKVTWFPAPRVKVIDTVGAGDCFNGFFAAELCTSNNIHLALSQAVARASSLISQVRKPVK